MELEGKLAVSQMALLNTRSLYFPNCFSTYKNGNCNKVITYILQYVDRKLRNAFSCTKFYPGPT